MKLFSQFFNKPENPILGRRVTIEIYDLHIYMVRLSQNIHSGNFLIDVWHNDMWTPFWKTSNVNRAIYRINELSNVSAELIS